MTRSRTATKRRTTTWKKTTRRTIKRLADEIKKNIKEEHIKREDI